MRGWLRADPQTGGHSQPGIVSLSSSGGVPKRGFPTLRQTYLQLLPFALSLAFSCSSSMVCSIPVSTMVREAFMSA